METPNDETDQQLFNALTKELWGMGRRLPFGLSLGYLAPNPDF
jgi:hypothetical protein